MPRDRAFPPADNSVTALDRPDPLSSTRQSTMTETLQLAARDEARIADAAPCVLPGFGRDSHGKPRIGLDAESLYAFGHLIRLTEQLILDQFSRGLVSGTTHTCLGQELTAMSVVRALDHPEDVVLSNHRNHGHFLTYSGDFVGLVAEIMGREAGVCGGWGGSQHLAYRHFHSNGVQGGMTGIGAGLALAHKLRGSGGIVAAIIGDGTLGQGLLYESDEPRVGLAGAAARRRRKQRHRADHRQRATRWAATSRRAARPSGFPPGASPTTIRSSVGKVAAVVAEVRAQPPARLPRARHAAHGAAQQGRRSARRATSSTASAPAIRWSRWRGSCPTPRAQAIEARNRAFVETVREAGQRVARGHARRCADAHLHAATSSSRLPRYPAIAAGSSVRQALNAALRHLLETDARTLLLGEDLHDPYGGAFKVTQGLSTEFPGPRDLHADQRGRHHRRRRSGCRSTASCR